MNSYITLDSKKYLCPHKKWIPTRHKPMTMRRTLDGNLDVTYGSGIFNEWRGQIRAYASSAPSGYGTVSDLRATLEKQCGVSFTDHYGTSYTVHSISPFPEDSLGPGWDSPSNTIDIEVVLVAE